MNLLFKLIRAFKKANGRSPTPGELAELQKQAMAPKSADIIKFPEGGKDRVPVEKQFGGIKSLDEFKESEDIYEIERKLLGENQNLKDLLKSKEGTISRIKGGISTKIKLNGPASNRDYAKELIGGKSEEFNSLKSEDKKELLDLLEAEIKKDMEEIPFAKGGLANVLGV